ncbi:MAG TPA: hypothetical protein DEH22_16070 [Chloroflexi bacterium]|nr:hypothetical protein [Chloroflexota bacterium]
MTAQNKNLEIIAPSIEEAIENGLAELGLAQEDVEIEVLDEGNKGLFGLGSRQARVLLTVKRTAEPASEVPPAKEVLPQPADESAKPEPLAAAEPVAEETTDEVLQIAHDTVAELLEKMKITALVRASYIEDDEYHGQKPVMVDIHGDDLSILIGRKAETLNALQYIASLIVGKELGHAVPLTIDIEGFRNRRQQQLKQLAQRIADQVAQTNRSQSLEPMPANERRIIHIELRGHPQVYTESAGDGEHRKVVIHPKSN